VKVLYINSYIREHSRTKTLADYLVNKIGGNVIEIVLSKEKISSVDSTFLQKRDKLISEGNFNDEMFSYAKDFAEADVIVVAVAAPYWDLSFPSILKVFFEHINVLKLVFDYSDKGEIVSFCKAKKTLLYNN
jgi:FMN-dependent NADH-azoreductase